MDKKLEAVLYWFFGTILTFTTVLLALMYVLAKVHGIQSDVLSGIASAGLAFIVVVAFLPALLVGVGVADDDRMTRYFEETGQLMTFRLNAVAWALWLILALMSLLKGFVLAVLIFILPNKDGEVPD